MKSEAQIVQNEREDRNRCFKGEQNFFKYRISSLMKTSCKTRPETRKGEKRNERTKRK